MQDLPDALQTAENPMTNDLPSLANGIWGIFDPYVPEHAKVGLADLLIDNLVRDFHDERGYAEIAAYAEYPSLREAAENNVRRIKEES